MKSLIFFSIFVLSSLLSLCLSFDVTLSLSRKASKRRKDADRHTTAKTVFLRAATLSGGQYIQQSWNQPNFIFQNTEVLTAALRTLTTSKPPAATLLNLGKLQSSSQEVSKGISLFFLSEMKRLKTGGPIIQAGSRIEPELQRLATSANQNTYLNNGLELLYEIYSKDLNKGVKTKNLNFNQETTISTADAAKKSKEIYAWINSRYATMNSLFLVEYNKHTSAFVGILPNLGFFFDPNFGIVRFTSIAQIDKFFLEIFNEKVFQDIYMDDGKQRGITLKAFN